MYPPKIHFLETRLPVSQRQADEHQPVYKTASVTTHGPSSRFSLLPHLSAQLKRWDPTVRINGRISTTENCQYLPRPPQNWTHKWKNSSSQHIPLSHRNRYVPLFLILCPHTVPVIPCLLFLMLSTIVSPSLLQIITPLRLVILHTHTEKRAKKEHYEEDKGQQGATVILSDEHFGWAKCSWETLASLLLLLLSLFSRHFGELCTLPLNRL